MASQHLLSAPPKATKSVDFQDKFPRFIANNYDDEPSKFMDAIKELNGLREATAVKTPDKHETGLDLIIRYYDQLLAIENKLPINEGQIHLKFTWNDAFQTGFLGSKSASQVSGVYERCCVLFNIGSLQSQIAKSQNFESDDGLKNAAKYFQGASGTFQQLREHVFAHLQTSPTPDLSAESTTALSTLMLAQAQEVFVFKAYKDKIKSQIIAKLAMQCADLYSEAISNMQLGSVKGQWDKGWMPTVAGKSQYFHAVAQQHLGLVARTNKAFGESVARLKKALALLKDAEKKGEGYFKPYDITATLKRDFEAVEKDNNFIYNDRVPDFGTLEPPGKATVAKSIQFQSPAINFLDLFASLVPLPVSRALSAYNTKKDDLVNEELEKIRTATANLNANLSGKNLPAAIEDTSGQQLPDSIRDKSEKLKAMGGMAALEGKMYSLPELLTRNREILDETQRMLDEEEREDKAMKERFKQKWNRTESGKLTESLRAEVAKFQGIVDTATKADMTVRQKFDSHRPSIATLSKDEGDLESSIPKAGAMATALSGSSTVQELRQIMEEVDTIKAEREVLEQQLKGPIADITGKFLSSLKEVGDVDEEATSEAHLQSEYGKFREQVTESLQHQTQLEQRLESVYGRFQQETQQHGSTARDNTLKDLAAAFDVYQELSSNLEEGSQFYNNLTPLLVKLQSKVSDFVFARSTEKNDLLKELQKDIAGTPSTSQPPQNPEYQQQPAQPKQPPSRPPPPNTQPQYQPQPPYQQPPQSYGGSAPPPPQGYYQPPPQGYAPPPQQSYGQPQPPPPQGYGYVQPPPGQYYQQPPPAGYAPQQPYYPPGTAPPPPSGYYQQGYQQQPYQPPPRR